MKHHIHAAYIRLRLTFAAYSTCIESQTQKSDAKGTKPLILNKPLDRYDFVVQSEDRKSQLLFSYKDIELDRYPSINYVLEVKDDHFTGQVEIWMTYEDLECFVEELLKAENNEADLIRLTAMSEEETEEHNQRKTISKTNGVNGCRQT